MEHVTIYIISAVVGLIYGGLIGVSKYFFLWKKLLNPKDDIPVTQKTFMTRMIISYAVNTGALLATLLTRDIDSLNFAVIAIVTALALSLTGKICPIYKINVQ